MLQFHYKDGTSEKDGNICWMTEYYLLSTYSHLEWDLFTIQFIDLHHNKSIFPTLGGDKAVVNL